MACASPSSRRVGRSAAAAVFPLLMRKGFGRPAGLLALAVGLTALAPILVLLDLRVLRITLPAMVALGPRMVVSTHSRSAVSTRSACQSRSAVNARLSAPVPRRRLWSRLLLTGRPARVQQHA